MWDIVIGAGGLVSEGLYYGILPGGDRIEWWVAPIRSRALDRFAVLIAVAFLVLLIAGIVHVA